jgi:hypothetical protein
MSSVNLISYDIPSVSALVDSGSSDCFKDTTFVNEHAISTYSVPPLQLRLFNGTLNSTITQAIDLSVRFQTGDITPMTFYVTPLDGSCSLVLGHNWLTHYNPLIDWVTSSISFRSPGQNIQAPPSSAPQPLDLPPPADPTPSDSPPSFSQHKAPPITIISAPAFALACRLQGSVQFSLQICPKESDLHSASTTSDPSEISIIPPEYHEFGDVFSKSKADTLAPHHEHDLKIKLEEGASPPIGTTYSLSPSELESLRTILDEHLTMGFIRPSSSAHAAPVLFVHKKDGSLHLCMDFRGLNKITKKDHYPLSRISDLLDAPSHAGIYTKIDLQHVYHLVCISARDEWKTSFHMHYGSYEWLVTPFGLTNALAVFQRFVNTVSQIF